MTGGGEGVVGKMGKYKRLKKKEMGGGEV